MLLDYDGTLVPFTATPELARPDAALMRLLRSLASRPDTEVHIVSGRSREALEQWVGELADLAARGARVLVPAARARRSGPRRPTSTAPGESRCWRSCATSPRAPPARSSR